MGCSEVEARLVDAVDGRLDPATSVRFHAHLEGCGSCRGRASLWRNLVPGLREAAPAEPGAMTVRRMQIEIERKLGEGAGPEPARGWRVPWMPTLGLAVLAAAAVVWLRRAPDPAPAPLVGYAAVVEVRGDLRIGEIPVVPPFRIPTGASVVLAEGAAAALAVDGGSTVRVEGPARFVLEGSRRDVGIHLVEGRVSAEVEHRAAGEPFAVITKGMRVEVRGTKFSVASRAGQSRLEVTEGRVAVFLSGGRSRVVSAGEAADSAEAEEPPAHEVLPSTPAVASRPLPCAEIARACQATTRSVHEMMRDGGSERALRVIAEGSREIRDVDPTCGAGVSACQDELRYLRAEALNQAGRLDEAVAAYRALDRRRAPAAMRQNALYAAAQIERRQGRAAEARGDYERALAAAPRGALREEALVGAMESAALAGDEPHARALARKYLAEYPRGLAAGSARRLSGDGTSR